MTEETQNQEGEEYSVEDRVDAIANLLIAKGVFSEEEYDQALDSLYEEEQ